MSTCPKCGFDTKAPLTLEAPTDELLKLIEDFSLGGIPTPGTVTPRMAVREVRRRFFAIDKAASKEQTALDLWRQLKVLLKELE